MSLVGCLHARCGRRALPVAGECSLTLLCCFQVELTGLNTVLVQNLSSLSSYLVSVQSRYPQGLSAAIIGNITTCKSQALWSWCPPGAGRSSWSVAASNPCLRCSEGASAFGPEGDSVLGQPDDRLLGRCRRRCCVLSHQVDFSEWRSPERGGAAFPNVLHHDDQRARMLRLLLLCAADVSRGQREGGAGGGAGRQRVPGLPVCALWGRSSE